MWSFQWSPGRPKNTETEPERTTAAAKRGLPFMSLFAGTNRLNSVPGQLIILRKTQRTYISELHMHYITPAPL